MDSTREKNIRRILGETFLKDLNKVIIEFNGAKYTHIDMIDLLGCGNFAAATRLNNAMHRLDIKTPHQLYQFGPFSLGREKGIGMTCLYVAMCILEYNDYDVGKWWGWDTERNKLEREVKFSTFKSKKLRKAKKTQ